MDLTQAVELIIFVVALFSAVADNDSYRLVTTKITITTHWYFWPCLVMTQITMTTLVQLALFGYDADNNDYSLVQLASSLPLLHSCVPLQAAVNSKQLSVAFASSQESWSVAQPKVSFTNCTKYFSLSSAVWL